MLKLLTGDLDQDNAEVAERVYHLRHTFFVYHLGWEALRKPNRRERDQFDGPGCVHVVGEELEEIVTYARLLPTTRPHLQSHVCPQILQGATAPTGPRIYEWTRQFVAPRKREGRGPDSLSPAGFGAVARAAEALGIEAMLIQTHPVLVDRVMANGWDVEPLALPTTYEGTLILPIIARLTPHTLATARAALAARGSILAEVAERRASPGASIRHVS